MKEVRYNTGVEWNLRRIGREVFGYELAVKVANKGHMVYLF